MITHIKVKVKIMQEMVQIKHLTGWYIGSIEYISKDIAGIEAYNQNMGGRWN